MREHSMSGERALGRALVIQSRPPVCVGDDRQMRSRTQKPHEAKRTATE
jgi:hypothetical protein